MEIKFSKNPLRCLRPILSQVHSQEQTLEVRLPDAYPDIGKVLSCWGQSVIRGKEWRNNGISANGGVMCWVLYAPEDGTPPRVVDAWIPFQCRWDFAENAENGTITLQTMLSSMDARSISARKMMLRAGIDTHMQAMETMNMELAVPSEIPEDVQLLTRNYPVQLPVEAGEKQVLIEENLTLPTGNPPIHKFVNYMLVPEISEQKVLSNRLVFRGDALLRVLYMTEEGALHTWNASIPFSQYTDLDREDMKAKLSKAREQNLKNVVDIINIQSSQYINELTKIAMTSKDEKLRADVLKYLLDHSIGKATSKQDINVTTTDKTAQLENIDDILKEIDVEIVDVDVNE